MFERMARLRPGISTSFELVRQERAVVGPRIAAMPIVRESVLGASRDRTTIEELRACILSVMARDAAQHSGDDWVALLPAQRAVSFDIRARRDLTFGECA